MKPESQAILTAAAAALLVPGPGTTTARAQESPFTEVWRIGVDDQSAAEFGGWSGATPAPGSATVRDDDYYLAGVYPPPIGELAVDEAWTNFERGMNQWDTDSRIHFTLTSDGASDARMRLVVDLIWGGSNAGLGWSTHDLAFFLNDEPIGSRRAVVYDTLVELEFDAAAARPGENVIRITRTNPEVAAWVHFDHLRLEIDDDALEDGDGDGLPRFWEETYRLDDQDGSDAALDLDGDGLDNEAEEGAGTNPLDNDSDNDGFADGEEAARGTNPLDRDSDDDTLADGVEVALGLDPLLADTDGDGAADNVERARGSDPLVGAAVHNALDGAIGVNFGSVRNPDSELGPHRVAGWVPQPFWNNTGSLPFNADPGGSLSALIDSSGRATTAAVAWSGPGAWFTTNGPDDPDAALAAGYLDSNADFTGDPCAVTFSGVPFASYHVVVHVGASVPGRVGAVRLNGDPASDVPYRADSAAPFPGWKRATAGDPGPADLANVVVFEKVSGPSFTVQNARINAGDNTGIHAIQVIDASADADGDTLPDAVELIAGTNPFAPDAGSDPDVDGVATADEIASGTDPFDDDTDDDRLDDGAEGVAGTDPLDPDTDGDGLFDGVEVAGTRLFASDPTLADTDADGTPDAEEYERLTDPSDPAFDPGDWTVPAYSTPGGVPTWTWTIDDLTLHWDHAESIMRVSPWNEVILWQAAVRLDTGPTTTGDDELLLSFRYRNGSIVWQAVTRRNVFARNGNNYWASDWNGTSDLKAALGFSGSGRNDISNPLRIRMTFTRPDPAVNSWSYAAEFFSLRDPEAPVLVHRHTRDELTAEHPGLLDGTATWEDWGQNAGRLSLTSETGVEMGLTRAWVDAEPDGDGDGMDDSWEAAFGVGDPGGDPDGDELTNLEEFLAGTHPKLADSDGDGADDGTEIAHHSDPRSADSMPDFFAGGAPAPGSDDFDGNGLSDPWEIAHAVTGLSWSGDADLDGIRNGDESAAGTDPLDPASALLVEGADAGDDLWVSWPVEAFKAYALHGSGDLSDWTMLGGLPAPILAEGRMLQELPGELAPGAGRRFLGVAASDVDTDGDGVSDWAEAVLGTDAGVGGSPASPDPASSSRQPLVTKSGRMLSGDFLSLLETMHAGDDGQDAGSGTARPPSRAAAARFLTQATFGPSLGEIDALVARGAGAFEAWLDDQLAAEPTLHQPYIEYVRRDLIDGPHLDPDYNFNVMNTSYVPGQNVTTPFARAATRGEDQLRQRVAFALAQILVISRQDAQLQDRPLGVTNFHDVLVRHAFGSYLDILMEVTLHPCMGWYLSHIGNQKADPSVPRFPDENYAREIMQLFTIGLWELNPDGTRRLDADGEPIPTYGNEEITELARVFTGLWYDVRYSFGVGGWDDLHYTRPMRLFPEHHDFGRKELLGGFVIPPRGQSAANGLQDIRDAVAHLFEHANTPPFVCRQLIQFLVTANPPPAYVRRVQDVFVDNGEGVRGDLGAVIRAILLDPEARDPRRFLADPGSGKLREPVLRTFALARAFEVGESHPDLAWWNYEGNFYEQTFQEPGYAPSVFNFFTPVYQAPGRIRESGLVSPVFQITDTFTSIAFPNLLWEMILTGLRTPRGKTFPFDYSSLRAVAGDTEALLDHVNLVLCAGGMSVSTRNVIRDAIGDPVFTEDERIALAAYLAAVSPDGAIQR